MTSRRLENQQQTNIRRFSPNGSMAGVGLAVLFAAVLAIGVAIGYMSV